ncbi:lipoprotein [Mycoplasma capricolum]|uniref:lipoprotein n=1 Tax=Mycoplasma capricolum TaxID=2095 RepID=UPI003DA65D29
MKKLLTIFGSISLISMTSIASIACKNINKSEKEEPSSQEKDKNKQDDQPKDNDEQADEPKKDLEKPKRAKEQNFKLIKKYGKEVLNSLASLEDKIEELYKKPENSELLKLATDIGQLYQKLDGLKTIDEFEKKFKSEYEKKVSSKSLDEFSNELFEQWDKTVTEYEKQKDSILKILKQ